MIVFHCLQVHEMLKRDNNIELWNTHLNPLVNGTINKKKKKNSYNISKIMNALFCAINHVKLTKVKNRKTIFKI